MGAKNTEKLNRHIFVKDNLEVLRSFDDESVDLIYLDPPFNSNQDFNAPIGSDAAGAHFKDRWTLQDTDVAWWGELADKEPALYSAIQAVGVVNGKKDKSYLIYMAMRLREMKRILKDTGSIYLHCDQTMSHSLKLVMDSIFGKENFRNEIIWHFPSMSRTQRDFPKKHNIILRYCQTKDFKFNSDSIRIPYASSTAARAKFGGAGFEREKGKPDYLNPLGKIPDSVWKIPHVKGKESVGYPTQKPRLLLERIIKASSNEGDLVLDPFCGCATTCIASENLNRKWIGIDLSEKAGELVKLRLTNELGYGRQKSLGFLHNIHIKKTLPIRNAPKPSKDIKWVLFGKQEGRCKGCHTPFEFRHFHKDHIIPKAKGGQDTNRNLQLLCGSCNHLKGTGDMTHLRAQLEKHFGSNYLMQKKPLKVA